MSHSATVDPKKSADLVNEVKDSLGAFWTSIFKDQDLLDAIVRARVLSSNQQYISAVENLRIRNHTCSPVFHREHWHPVFIRKSQRNTGVALTVGMMDTPFVGAQPTGSVYLDNAVFEVGSNAEYSKVNTYPITAFNGCNLVSVHTCMCDSVSNPNHILLENRDFSIKDGVLIIRKEKDPFDVSGFYLQRDGDDTVATLWACDAEFDEDNVSDFIGYPLGVDTASTKEAAVILSATWDLLVFGVTPFYLNQFLGAIFGVDVIKEEEKVVSVISDGSIYSIVTTDKNVYKVKTAWLREDLSTSSVAGIKLNRGEFLVNTIRTYSELSPEEFIEKLDKHLLNSITLHSGSVLGVDVPVVVEDFSTPVESGAWFKLNSGDSKDSPFWSAVFSRTTEYERETLINKISVGGSVNPLRALGYTALANTILIFVAGRLVDDKCVQSSLAALQRLVPPSVSLYITQNEYGSEFCSTSDSTKYSIVKLEYLDDNTSSSDSVVFRFIPDAATEV